MKQKLTLTLLLFTGLLSAQDIIKLTNGAELNVHILKNNPEAVGTENATLKAPYFIAKIEIDEIRYENGTTEKIPHPEMTLEEIKNNTVRIINETAHFQHSDRNIRATIEGDLIRLTEINKDGSNIDKGIAYNFKAVYKFDELATRRELFSFVNLFTELVKYPERTGKDRMDKVKLVLRCDDYEKGAILLASLKQLHKALNKR